jgi:DNA polymerase III epsilon subunit
MQNLPPITVFDVETTGLDPKKGHRVVELAGVRVENGQILADSAFSSFVNPEREIPWEVKNINHIDDAMVAGAPTIMSVLPQFLEFAQGSLLFAHNAAFDRGFLECEKEFCWGYVELPETFCTMKLSQSLFPAAFRHNLDTICERFSLQFPENRHRALPDVILTAQALLKMIEHGKIRSADELRQRSSLQPAVPAAVAASAKPAMAAPKKIGFGW